MARVVQRKARKDYPDQGIKKGDLYYYVSMKTGPRSSGVMRSLTPFKPSQLTNSEFRSVWLQQIERVDTGDLTGDDIREMAEALREIGNEAQERFDAMPEGLQQGDTGQMLEERVSACETAADALDEQASEMDDLEEPDEPEYGDLDKDSDEYQELLSEYEEARQEYENAKEDIEAAVADALGDQPD